MSKKKVPTDASGQEPTRLIISMLNYLNAVENEKKQSWPAVSASQLGKMMQLRIQISKNVDDLRNDANLRAHAVGCLLQGRGEDPKPLYRLSSLLTSRDDSGAKECWPDVEAHMRECLGRVKGDLEESGPADKKPHPPSNKSVEERLRQIPPLVSDGATWVSAKNAAKSEGLETRTLAKYRGNGIRDPGGMSGIDPDGRMWRKRGTGKSHPKYLRASLKSEREKQKKP